MVRSYRCGGVTSPIKRGDDLLAWLAAVAPRQRDAAFEALLDIASDAFTSPGPELIGNLPSGVAAVVHAVHEIPIRADDVFVDVGAGAGKVVMLVRLLTAACVCGVELQADLVARARHTIAARGLAGIDVIHGDARAALPDDGTVYFLYLPCTGVALEAVLQRLREISLRRSIVVCTLGLDLRTEAWLRPRALAVDSFWLAIYDSAVEGNSRRAIAMSPDATAIALERPGYVGDR